MFKLTVPRSTKMYTLMGCCSTLPFYPTSKHRCTHAPLYQEEFLEGKNNHWIYCRSTPNTRDQHLVVGTAPPTRHTTNTPLESSNEWGYNKPNHAGQPHFSSSNICFKLDRVMLATMLTEKVSTVWKISPTVIFKSKPPNYFLDWWILTNIYLEFYPKINLT